MQINAFLHKIAKKILSEVHLHIKMQKVSLLEWSKIFISFLK